MNVLTYYNTYFLSNPLNILGHFHLKFDKSIVSV